MSQWTAVRGDVIRQDDWSEEKHDIDDFGLSPQGYARMMSISLEWFYSFRVSGVVGRSWRYCNARPTRDRAGASS